ncbi:hypothetical protein PR002_g3915 [Phytophthora rubi]|uniref:Uncharacterized protein n=1 Tax=Phytophthora rubi TaxID=129364 RepID=A0A6A3NAH9_9STRA|nr:hypothetical protein PR002_g3915 [Phytophthora rubi]
MGTKQQPARPSHGGAARPSPLAARTRRAESTAFPRSDLWSWTDDGAKDELIESMLRECVPPVALPSTPALNGNAPLPVGGNSRSLLPSQRHKLASAGQHAHPQAPSTGPSSSSRKARNLQSPATSLPPTQLQPMSSKNLMAAASSSTGQEAWKAFKVAHRTNKILAKTRKVINLLIRQNSSMKNVHDGENGPSDHGDDDGAAERDADIDAGDKEKEIEEMRAAAAAAAKLMEAKAMFQREVLDEDPGDSSQANGGANASGSVSSCQIDIGDCNLEILDGNLEGSIYGGGTFSLNMGERSDGIFLRELLQLVWKNKTEIMDAVHNGVPFSFNRKDEKALVSSIPSQGSMQIKVQPNYDRHEELISPSGFDRVVKLMDRSFCHSHDGDEAAKLFCVRILAEEYTFTVAEANTLLSVFESHTSQVEKASAAAALIPQILQTPSAQSKLAHEAAEEIYDCAAMETPNEFFEDKDADGKIDVCGDICITIGLENLSDIEQSHVEHKVGKWISFNVNNPSGRYQLNMANSIDRRILMRILEVNKIERKMRQQLKLMDTSQYGLVAQPLQGGFRNMRLNHLPIMMGANWQFPRLGILEFDFVMTRRPYTICTALNDSAFEQFLKEFKQLQVTSEMKLVGLRSISTLYYFTCSQTQRIMEHFGTFERDPATGCLCRGEAFIVLFSRIVDEWNLSETLSLLDLTTKTQVLDRLGVLNCFHPLQQIESYRQLQLSAFDQRQMILILVKLAASGEAELTNAQLNGDVIESDVWKAWISDDKLPAQGVLSCSMRAIHGMQSEAQLPATSVRKKLIQSLLFKLEDKAHEQPLL